MFNTPELEVEAESPQLRQLRQGYRIASAKAFRPKYYQDTDLKELSVKLTDLGVFSETPDIGDLRLLMDDAVTEMDPAAAEAKDEASILPAWVSRTARTAKQTASKAYVFGDDAWKATAFISERQKLKWQHRGRLADETMKMDEVERQAAENVKQVMQNYGRLPDAARFWAAIPVGPYISFQVASLQNLRNGTKIALQEMGLAEPDQGSLLAKHGVDRKSQALGVYRLGSLVGVLTAKAAKYPILAAAAAAAAAQGLDRGDGEEEEKMDAIRLEAPDYQRYSELHFVGSDPNQVGVDYYIDGSYSNYFQAARRAVRAAMLSGEFNEEPWQAAMDEVTRPWRDPDIFPGLVMEAMTNEDHYGNPIYREPPGTDSWPI